MALQAGEEAWEARVLSYHLIFSKIPVETFQASNPGGLQGFGGWRGGLGGWGVKLPFDIRLDTIPVVILAEQRRSGMCRGWGLEHLRTMLGRLGIDDLEGWRIETLGCAT